jgi:hypothetical protein
MQPSASRLTFNPVFPKRVYSTSPSSTARSTAPRSLPRNCSGRDRQAPHGSPRLLISFAGEAIPFGSAMRLIDCVGVGVGERRDASSR